MKKVYLVLVPMLPCPSVKGGAIETLLTNLAKENEKNPKVELHIILKYDRKAVRESRKYKNTDFIFIKYGILNKICFKFYKIFRKLKKDPLTLTYYYHTALNKISKEADFIVAEGGNNEMFIPFEKRFGREKLVLHLHYELQSDEMLNRTFGNLISVSQFIEKRYGADKTVNTKVLKNGVNIDNLKKRITKTQRNFLRSQYHFDKEDFVVLFCGRLIKEKGILQLIRSLKRMKEKNIKLLVVGSANFGEKSETDFEKELREEAENLKRRVIFSGYIPNEKLNEIYQIADVHLIPSVLEDPAPLVAMEGMASGLPIIATKSGGMVEYINEDCAIILEKEKNLEENLRNAILELYHDPERCKSMGKNGRLRAKQFSTKQYYKDFVEIMGGLGNGK